MNLNWERLSLSGYFEALEAHNLMHDPDAKPSSGEVDIDRLKRALAAHSMN